MIRSFIFSVISLFLFISVNYTQSFDSWVVGSTQDISSTPQAGLVLAGGGTDNDNAMSWMLQRADGGDVVILRTSGTDGYNDYFMNQLGVTVNSVETIRINNSSGSADPYVLEKVGQAELLFFAGGDQTTYYDYWQGTLLQDTINYLINNKQITVGGTSAGMMILGEYQYVPQSLGVLSSEALSDPFHQYMDTIYRNQFLNHPIMGNTINDSHFDNDGRAGRLTAFLARMTVEDDIQSKGIAANEVTAICIDENNIAHVYGDHPTYDDYAYFVKARCPEGASSPENCEPGQALHWVNDSMALQVYKVPGTPSGSFTFDLNNWTSGNGGSWEYWFSNQGTLNQVAGSNEMCDLVGVKNKKMHSVSVYPNPAKDYIVVENNKKIPYRIFDGSGKLIYEGKDNQLSIQSWDKGCYTLQFFYESKSYRLNWIKE